MDPSNGPTDNPYEYQYQTNTDEQYCSNSPTSPSTYREASNTTPYLPHQLYQPFHLELGSRYLTTPHASHAPLSNYPYPTTDTPHYVAHAYGSYDYYQTTQYSLEEEKLEPGKKRTWTCQKPGCASTTEFSRKADLDRHVATVHDKRNQYPCLVPGCGRMQRPFTRKEHLTEHLRAFHGDAFIPKRKRASDSQVENERDLFEAMDVQGKAPPPVQEFHRSDPEAESVAESSGTNVVTKAAPIYLHNPASRGLIFSNWKESFAVDYKLAESTSTSRTEFQGHSRVENSDTENGVRSHQLANEKLRRHARRYGRNLVTSNSHFREVFIERRCSDLVQGPSNSLSSSGLSSEISETSLDANDDSWESEDDDLSSTPESRHAVVLGLAVLVAYDRFSTRSEELRENDPGPSDNNSPGDLNSTESSNAGQTGRSGASKRGREASSNNNEDGDDTGAGGGRRPKKCARGSKSLDPRELLACPYSKYDTHRYRTCSKHLLRNITRVKQHLWRHHDRHCPVCYQAFDADDKRDRHVRKRECEVRDPATWQGLDERQKKVLKRPMLKQQSEKEQWYSIYRIIFPGHPEPESHYVEESFSDELVPLYDFICASGSQVFRSLIARPSFAGMAAELSYDNDDFLETAFRAAVKASFEKWETTRQEDDNAPFKVRVSPQEPISTDTQRLAISAENASTLAHSTPNYGTSELATVVPSSSIKSTTCSHMPGKHKEPALDFDDIRVTNSATFVFDESGFHNWLDSQDSQELFGHYEPFFQQDGIS